MGGGVLLLSLSTVLALERAQYASPEAFVSSRTKVPRDGGRKRAAQAHQVPRRKLELEAAPPGRYEDGLVVHDRGVDDHLERPS